MRFGIFGDIHSNLEALQAVLEDMQKMGVTHKACIGDIVGYNANPAECLDIVRSMKCPIIKGNHDEEATLPERNQSFNDMALESIRYTRAALSQEQLNFLRVLPVTTRLADNTCSLVHASLDQPLRWGYILTLADANASFIYQKGHVCFYGHTHVPHAFIQEGHRTYQYLYNRIDIEANKRYLINVGSVGQPRDGDWRAAYVIYDSKENFVELRRVTYDLSSAQTKILKAGLPQKLSTRLAEGY